MSKESLFNVLNNHYDFEEIKVLDLFAGTGNLSYEFGSRGTKNITCVDEDFGCIKFIKQTAAEFGFDIAAIKSNVFPFLDKNNTSYDIILADPPYHMEQPKLEKIIETIFNKKLLAPEGMLIIEHSKHSKINHMTHFSFQKNYGGSIFSFFEIKKEANDFNETSD